MHACMYAVLLLQSIKYVANANLSAFFHAVLAALN